MEIIIKFYNFFEFFLYGIYSGIVIHFFEKETFTFRTIYKFLVFGFLTLFSKMLVIYFCPDIGTEKIIIPTLLVSGFVYLFALYIFQEKNKDRIGSFLFDNLLIALGELINRIFNRNIIDIKKQDNKFIITKKQKDEK